jgi:diaminohydroxyphosphoribosylaminopyrimidine deaminase / 5-amino-6-(5-phosphoribosylamino)uracil reductase
MSSELSPFVFMQRCFHLADLGSGNTAPNPMVGAVLVYDGKIIGEGYHEFNGGPHAEVNCIGSVKSSDRHLIPLSTLYVSLEPCCHHGKTPPCTDLIIREKIKLVVIGCRDPFPMVNGKGIEILRANGVVVECPILEESAKGLNRRFFTFHMEKRPYIILKWAQSANRKIASDREIRKQISNKYSNRLVHKWRSEEAGIMVGTRTALLDNPELTTRLWRGQNPIRILPDLRLRLPDYLNLLDGTVDTIVLNGRISRHSGNIRYIQVNLELEFIPAILSALYREHILSILVEGGKNLLQSFIDYKAWDELRIITNNELIIEEGMPAPEFSGAGLVKSDLIGGDSINYYERLIT